MTIIVRKNHFISLVFLFVVAVLSITIIATNSQKKLYRSRAEDIISPTPEASPSAQIALLGTMIESKNTETDNLLNKYEQTIDEGEKQNIVSSLETNLTERKNNQLSLLKLSPKAVYNKVFSKDTIERLKKIAEIKEESYEKPIDKITGTVNTTIYDNFDNNTSYTTATFIPDDNEEQEINFYPADNQTFLSGTKVTLNDAIRIDEDKQVLGVSSSMYAQEPQEQDKQPQSHLVAVEIEAIETPPLDTLGEQKALVLLACLDYLDCDQLPTPQEIKQRINNEIHQFFKRDSYNNMSLVADTTDKWFRIKKEVVGNLISSQLVYKSLVPKEKILSEFAHEVELKGYDRLGIILISENNDIKGEGGESSLGKWYNIKIANKTQQFSLLTVFASLNRGYFFSTAYHTEDGDMSYFDKVFSHEFIHSMGGQHAQQTNTAGNTFVSINELKKVKETIEEYGNPFEIMGRADFGLYSNAYIKQEFQWIGQNSEGNLIKIDIDKPEGEYSLKKMGSAGQIATWLPYSFLYKEKTTYDSSHVDYFLEYRKTTQQKGLVINLLETRPFSYALVRSILFPSTLVDGLLVPAYKKNEIFFDQAHQTKIEVKDIDDNMDTLTFTINRCQKNKPPDAPPFYLIPDRGGNGKISSINAFENDLRSFKSFGQQQFFIDNVLDCAISLYSIKYSILDIEQGNILITWLNFSAIGQSIAVYPYKTWETLFTISGGVNDPKLPKTTFKFSMNKYNNPPSEKTLMYELNLVTSIEEYKNDLEPHMINIKDQDANNKEFNHLETEKGQTLIFTSNIANNSRNPNGNKSSDFIIKWDIQDDKGNNVIPPFTQRHDGIPPRSIDDERPAILTWTISQDLKVGDYKIILEVDSNNRLQEFNENNNLIWRYFSVVE